MYMPSIETHRAYSIPEALDLLVKHGPKARLLAGGTDLLVDLKAKRVSTDHVISITRVEELRGVSLDDDCLRIGALTTITELDESPLLDKRFDPIRDATQRMAVRQIRNIATVGGNLSSAVPCADLPPILTAMDARVRAISQTGEREIPVGEFIVDVRRTALRDGEILKEIVVPLPPPRVAAAYARFGLREGNAIAVAASAAGLQLSESGRIASAAIVLGAVAPTARIATRAAASLTDREATEEAFAHAARLAREEADPICDVRGSADFRRELVEVLTRRALTTAHQRAVEGRDE